MCMRADKNEKETIIVVTHRGEKRGEKRERKSKKEKRAYGGEGEMRREESERVEGESNVSECMAMERL